MKGIMGGWRSLAIGGAVFSLFAVGVGLAGAQRGPDGPPPGPGVTQPDEERGALRGEFQSRLAAKLGISVDTLSSAMQSTREEMRPLVEARMQQMHERMRDLRGQREGGEGAPRPHEGMRRHFGGPPGEGFRGPGPGPDDGFRGPGPGPGEGFRGPGPGGRIAVAAGPRQMINGVAESLGLEPEELRAELRQGKSLAQIAQEHGKSPDALADEIVTRIQETNGQMLRDMIRRMMDRSMPVPGGAVGSAL